MVRLTRWPPSSVCQPFSRAASTRSAIISIAVSRSRSSQSVAYGRRYLTVVTRVGLVTNCLLALPLGHSRPRLIGESGSPSIWTIFSSLTNTRWPQPTAQYGQTDFTTLSAVAVRLTTCSVALLRAAVPRPSGSAPVSCRNTGHASSHVFTCGTLPLDCARRASSLHRIAGFAERWLSQGTASVAAVQDVLTTAISHS